MGNSYNLTFNKFFDEKIPNFTLITRKNLYDLRRITKIVNGKENIIKYLSEKDPEYKTHAEIIRKINF